MCFGGSAEEGDVNLHGGSSVPFGDFDPPAVRESFQHMPAIMEHEESYGSDTELTSVGRLSERGLPCDKGYEVSIEPPIPDIEECHQPPHKSSRVSYIQRTRAHPF